VVGLYISVFVLLSEFVRVESDVEVDIQDHVLHVPGNVSGVLRIMSSLK